MDQRYTLRRFLKGAWQFAKPVQMCFVNLEKAFDLVSPVILCRVLQAYGVSGSFIHAVHSVCRSQSLFRITNTRSFLFLGEGWTPVGPSFSAILFITFKDRISMLSPNLEGVHFGDLRIGSLLFADDVVLLASSARDLQMSLDWFTAECEVGGMRISTSKSEAMVLRLKKLDCLPLVVKEF